MSHLSLPFAALPDLVSGLPDLTPVLRVPLAFIPRDLSPAGIAVVIGALVLSLAFHEAAHAWAAHRLGDDTAERQGRLTLNPIAHIDLFNTIILPTILALTTPFIFGGAKPVPVNPRNFRNPQRDNALVALAGPLSNILLALIALAALHVVIVSGNWEGKMLPRLLAAIAGFNVLLAVFNMIPIPPLDGSRVVSWLLPSQARASYDALEQFGLILIMGLIFLVPQFRVVLGTTIESVFDFLYLLVTLWGLW